MVRTRSFSDGEVEECQCSLCNPNNSSTTQSHCIHTGHKRTTVKDLFRSKDGPLHKIGSFVSDRLGITLSATISLFITLSMAAFAGYIHWRYLMMLFENDHNFSRLSALEKEMAFRTEMGLYYSYFKNFIRAPSFTTGLHFILNDQFTEYPLVINALKRFSLYPEVFVGMLFRVYTGLMDFIGIPTITCWDVDRGNGQEPVEICTGMGDPTHFYVSAIFILNGFLMSLFCIYGAYLSRSCLGGLVTVLCLFFNHGESTRVMWTPPLRESFAYPFFVLQMLLLTCTLRRPNPGRGTLIGVGVCNVLFVVSWSFAQCVLQTQIACLFACYILDYIPLSKIKALLTVHVGVVILRDSIKRHFDSLAQTAVAQGVAWHVFLVFFKLMMSSLFDGFSNDTALSYVKTLVLPAAVAVVAAVTGKIVFHCLQLLVFSLMALLVMRLKLLLVPHMCLMASLICSRPLFSWVGERHRHECLIYGLLSIMAIQGVVNYESQWNIMVNLSNPPQEELLQWIKTQTKPNAVFAGASSTMASVWLSTGRPIVNLPHFEHPEQRRRSKLVYSVYSRKSAAEAHRNLSELHVDYFILEDFWCMLRSRPGCSMPEIWDEEDSVNRGQTPLCARLSVDSEPFFTTLFQNKLYKVLRVPKEPQAS
ncbi:probable C-mannosyltransferase DPY19L1 [Chanos chanos]|uniref:Probable C-mannosyltransferase DPY19L1 n=1 Tax=Chanos chanos TaxID=29144 RepID=A0A6J2WNH3_CHACN|nr:probable C-mannosyltransferase DPY19L1 [Chanos chanos]